VFANEKVDNILMRGLNIPHRNVLDALQRVLESQVSLNIVLEYELHAERRGVYAYQWEKYPTSAAVFVDFSCSFLAREVVNGNAGLSVGVMPEWHREHVSHLSRWPGDLL
jgi:hypothetical protein